MFMCEDGGKKNQKLPKEEICENYEFQRHEGFSVSKHKEEGFRCQKAVDARAFSALI